MNETTQPFACRYTPELAEIFYQLDCSLVLSTYQAGKVIMMSSDGEQFIQLPRTFDTPMGLAVDGGRMAVAAKHEIVLLANEPRLGTAYPNKPNYYDGFFVPRSSYYCGALNVHDMAFCDDGLVGVNTLFSCLFKLDDQYSFIPTWKPPFITEMASEDRCHLNGMAVLDGKPRYVTALGETDTMGGWRENKLAGGILMDIESNEILLRNLPMPHSPRIYDGKLYLLLSATGEIAEADLENGTYTVLNKVDGFVRGMARHGDYLFVTTSRLRKTHTFGDLPLAKNKAVFCGVSAFHFPTMSLVGQLRYLHSCEEIYDVQVLPGIIRPGILGISNTTFRRALTTPETTYWGREQEET